jgi:hypothetical protein
MDPRLRAAVEASVRWYDDVFALHRIPVRVEDGLWISLGPPPPWHSAAKTLQPGVGADRVAEAVGGPARCAVADSWGDLNLAPYGFHLLIEATWLLRTPRRTASRALPPGWSVVKDFNDLAQWSAAHDYAGVLPPAVLEHPRFRILACHREGRLVGGAVVHDAGGAVGLSNTWGAGRVAESEDVLRAASALHPDRDLTDYGEGTDRDAMVSAGFTPLGPQRVWIR